MIRFSIPAAGLLLAGCASTGGMRMQVEASRAAHQEGLSEYERANYKEAIERFGEAIELNRSNHDAYLMRAKARLKRIDQRDGRDYLEETSRAFDDLNTSIRVYPINFDAYYHRAVAYASVARYRDAAYDLLNHCLSLRPEDPLTNLLLAKVYDQGFEGRQALALRYYKEHLRIAGPQADPGARARAAAIEATLRQATDPAERERRAAELFEAAMELVGRGNKAEALKLLTEITTRYGETRFAKRNEKLIPQLIQSLQPNDGGR